MARNSYTFRSAPRHGGVFERLFLRPALCWVFLYCLFAHTAGAQTNGSGGEHPPFSLQGFGTLGLARSTTDQAEFVRDLSQPGGVSKKWSAKIDSAAGLQVNWHATEDMEAVAQIVKIGRAHV